MNVLARRITIYKKSAYNIGYIERGTRPLSNDYALLLSQALQVRVQYLLLEDDYMTEEDRINSHGASRDRKRELLEELMSLHFYGISDFTKRMPIEQETQHSCNAHVATTRNCSTKRQK